MASLLVVTGPPGSGKSTVSAALAQRSGPSALVEGDRFFGFLARGAIEPWLPESDEQNRVVMAAAASAAGRFAQSGFATVFDGIVGPWFLDLFLSSTGLTELDYVVLLPSVETCIERVRNRTDHDFRDESATRKMHEEFADASVEDRHVLTIGTKSIAEVTDRISGARDAGRLRHTGD